MKFSNFLRHAALVLAPLGLAALPASAYTVTIDETLDNPGFNIYERLATDDEGNIIALEGVGVGWNWESGYDEDGNYYEYRNYYFYSDPTFRGVQTSAETYTLPEEVRYVVNEDGHTYELTAPITRFEIDNYLPSDGMEFNNGSITGFPNCDNLKNIVVPNNYSYCAWHGSGFVNMPNFYFSNPDVPNLRVDGNTSNYLVIWVNDNLLEQYEEYFANSNVAVESTTPVDPVVISLTTAGTLASTLSGMDIDYGTIRDLTIKGEMSEEDLANIRRMKRLHKLNLESVTGVEAFTGCANLKYLENVTLPADIKTLSNRAFYGCSKLSSINLPATVTNIGAEAFRDCYNLTSIDLSKISNIESSAFKHCNLESVNISGLKNIPGECFYFNRNLHSVVFGENLTNISGNSFQGCNFTSIVIPNSVKSLDWCAFAENYNLKNIELGSGLTYISEGAFYGVSPEVLKVHYLFPLEYTGFEYYSSVTNATAYVPAISFNDFFLNDRWMIFDNIEPLKEELTEITIDRPFTIKSNTGIAAKANLTLDGSRYWDNYWHRGDLTVNADLSLGKYTQKGGEYYHADTYGWDENNNQIWAPYYGSTLVSNANVTADEVEVNLNLWTNGWHFLTFPYDVNVKDIKWNKENALWVVRKYSGKDRAELTDNTWQNMVDGDVLKAGEGYILHCYCEDSDWVEFTFPAANNGNAFFAKEAVETPLADFESEFAHNASWNLVGNTYPSFVNIASLGFSAPVTVYDANSYYAYSPIDDEYVFRPFQAFFVQGANVTKNASLVINPEGRAHTPAEAYALAPQKAPMIGNSGRALFNIFINGENGKDRTRIVVNEEAEMGYEGIRDASKFMSSEAEVPQIFVNNGGNRMAIDERPLADGVFQLGSRIGKSGEYSISLETRNAQGYAAILTDNKTGISCDLLSTAYAFTADAENNDNRFTLCLMPSESGVDAAAAEGIAVNVAGNVLNITAAEAIDITVAAADGKVVARGNAASFSAELEGGVYVVKAGAKTVKVNVK